MSTQEIKTQEMTNCEKAEALLDQYTQLKDSILDTSLHFMYDGMLYDILGYREELLTWDDEKMEYVVLDEDLDLLQNLKEQVQAVADLIDANKRVSYTFC